MENDGGFFFYAPFSLDFAKKSDYAKIVNLKRMALRT